MMMKVSGLQIREAISLWEARRDTASAQFADSLTSFNDEKKDPPASLAQVVQKADISIASLQEAQARYNLAVRVMTPMGERTLCWAIKSIGGASRLHTLWKDALGTLTGGGRSMFMSSSTRSKDEERARATLTVAETLALRLNAAKNEQALRSAVARGNAVELEMDLDSALFE